ncbi:hypothetical protein AAZX31_06G115600 [Glycine max]|uniref:Uncharacterized protein n=1 Tax=Glycine max TaxID=3847 RepID=K7KUM8_SOYBN|nr:uncharacterized protein LOC102665666 [Glycine max]KAG5031463.1 hypothetical protein JHK85_015445 [Glycine max]KAG5045683.1 hypothetical protein JHK86_015089 [Glycine max]KAG5148189.1 hypothetical protein JHK82_015070 [Glycine max]KAH1125494.1 hypothetical protein GYH30_014866 [Glycine max]KAH1245451.1 hypothetical protein GmHk_06G015789 [Glycine max]|eukprot:XP_006581610.1 uncharacterized protein LOC102665666 [Glycine max]
MVSSRRPARFQKPDFMQTKPIGEEKLEVLRVAAAAVFLNEQNPEGESSFQEQEVMTNTGYGKNVRDETDNNDNGMELLATVATRIITKRVEKKKLRKEKLRKKKLPLPLDLRWGNQKLRAFS